MLGHPALIFAQVRSNAESKALFAQQHISAVAGVDGNNGVVFREVADVTLFGVDLAFAVESAHPVGAVAKCFHYFGPYTGHDGHVQYNIN